MKRILCVLIAAIWLCTCWAGNGKKTIVWEQPIAESNQLFSSLWRNDATGDWEIGFYDDFAIYDCRYWQYKQKNQKGDKYSFILTDGKSDLTVNIDKPQHGKRTMSINGKKAEYSLISILSLLRQGRKSGRCESGCPPA